MSNVGSSSELPGLWNIPARAFPVCAAAASVFAICMMCVTPSFAQTDPGPVVSPVPANPAPAAPENAPHTEELGMPLGSFRLYPVLDLRAGYDTNVFAQPAG